MLGLVADNLTCVKRDRVLFDALSFSLSPGQLLYLRGPNGAGKTSLLRLLTGLSEPDKGIICFDGTPINTSMSYQRELVYLGHKTGLNGNLTALENLRFWLAQHEQPYSTEATLTVLEKVGLAGMEEMPVRMLSAGQQRRVALARLWLKPARVWILDEPFTALDTDGIALLEQAFASHTQNGGMLMTTSHQPLSDACGNVDYLDLEFRF
ncbi:cytochrome c biogenesis heme-transporting ATPase CcmA [Alteromonas sp. CYL-A6]|uniref:cytochrome c biogenesis heme-transporting ATPase CcmA n=1 Tax=Alteromonas nitratireducens TaxID=3390813 RepID=UPI0034B07DDD